MPLRPTLLAPDVRVLTAPTLDANTTVFLREGPHGREALVVDALASREDARALAAYVEGELGARVALLLVTHGFSDHMAGAQHFPDALLMTHRRFADTFRAERFRSEEEAGFFRTPDVALDGPVSLQWGAHRLDVLPCPGHTASTLHVDVPSLDVLHSADTAVGRMAYLAYGRPEALAAALERAMALGRSRVIQGHGGVTSGAVLSQARTYIDRLLERAGAAKGDPERMRAIRLADCLAPGLEGSDFEAFFHGRNVELLASGAGLGAWGELPQVGAGEG